MKNLQGEVRRAVLAGPGPLWLVVGWPGRAPKARSGFFSGTRNSFRRTAPIPRANRTTEVAAPRSGINSAFRQSHAFTLLELLLVLALLAMAVAVAAPSLSRFFAGRSLDSEGRRLLAMTRYAQNRAVSEGVPMVMWFNPELRSYGVQAELTYDGNDTKAVEYQLADGLQLELPSTALANVEPVPWKVTADISGIHPSIRFTPDGYIAESSPQWVWLRVQREDQPDAVWLALNDNGLNYELQNNQPVPR